MKVQWKAFSQRRGLEIKDFRHMEYGEFVRWCEYRNVIPPTSEEYSGNSQEELIEVETIEISAPVYEAKHLKKKLKNELQQMCIQNGLDIESSWTKKKLVSILVDLNNR